MDVIGNRTRRLVLAGVCLVLSGVALAADQKRGFGDGGLPLRPPPAGHYAVAVSEATYARPAWRQVVDVLRGKYGAEVIRYSSGKVRETLPELRRQFPSYVCFVATPEECGRAFVVALHRVTREVDDDPYGDVLWGILTGYEASDALRLAQVEAPLLIRRGATSMGPGLLSRLDGGFASNEDNTCDFWVKSGGATGAVHQAVAPDAARALAEAFTAHPADVFYTSGHATERDWQIAYNIPGGAFRHEGGTLFAQSTDGRRYPVDTSNPKVYLPVGNCLIGHIDRRDCMATAWLHTGGVCQMIGYTVVTFYGYMGWGTGLLFDGGPHALSDAFFLNNQALIHRLATRYPDVLSAMPEPDAYNAQAITAFAASYANGQRDALGLLWDRDTVAFYGDPAWLAQYPPSQAAVGFKLQEEHGLWTVRVTVLKDDAWCDPKWGPRPLMCVLPERVCEIRDVTCSSAGSPVITDRFVLVPVDGDRRKGDVHVVTFKARRVEEPRVK